MTYYRLYTIILIIGLLNSCRESESGQYAKEETSKEQMAYKSRNARKRKESKKETGKVKMTDKSGRLHLIKTDPAETGREQMTYKLLIIGSGVGELEIRGFDVSDVERIFGKPSQVNKTSNISNTHLGGTTMMGLTEEFDEEYVYRFKGEIICVLFSNNRVVRAFEFWSSY